MGMRRVGAGRLETPLSEGFQEFRVSVSPRDNAVPDLLNPRFFTFRRARVISSASLSSLTTDLPARGVAERGLMQLGESPATGVISRRCNRISGWRRHALLPTLCRLANASPLGVGTL